MKQALVVFSFLAGVLLLPSWASDEGETEVVSPFVGIDKLLEEGLGPNTSIGHSALVFAGGEVVHYGQAGMRDQAQDLPIERDSIFRIYSMTKPITSVAAMQLVEQGKLGLDDPVAKYLPEFAELKVWVGEGKEPVTPKRAMTVRDLMRHTSGLTYGFYDKSPVGKQYQARGVLITDETLEITIEKLSKIPLVRHPGVRWHYGVSTDVLGRVVEVASEMTLAGYFQTKIFDPLGMKDTGFTVPKEEQGRFVEMYRPSKKGLVPAFPLQSVRYLNEHKFYSGGGGLCSTIDDYLRFCQALVGQGKFGEHSLLKPESLDEMYKNQLETVEQSWKGFQFGLGFRIDPKFGDYSWGGAAGTRFWVNPEKGLVILYMVQTKPDGGSKTAERIRRFVYEKLSK